MNSSAEARSKRLTSEEINNILCECESSEDNFINSESDEEYFPPGNEIEASDTECVGTLENGEESYESEDSDENDEVEKNSKHCAKDGTYWQTNPFPESQALRKNILRERGGAAQKFKFYTCKQIFKSILSTEMCDMILRETNRKGQKIIREYNDKIGHTQKKIKTFEPFREEELDAALGILIFAGVHKSNKEHTTELWKPTHLPLFRAAMSICRFRMLLQCIRFDNEIARKSRIDTDKAAAFRDIWTMFNANLSQSYKPGECITVDEQLYGYRGRTRFTQYMPSKPEKYGIKIFWACDSSNSYPLCGKLYTGREVDMERQKNIGERTVLELVSAYKNSGRNITTGNVFTSLELAKTLNYWNLSLVGTVRKNKRFLPAIMQPHKDRLVFLSYINVYLRLV